MLKVQRKLNANTIIEADGQTTAEVFEKLASLEEVFRVTQCGKCGCDRVTFTVRRDKEDHVYYQAQCLDANCGAEFRFGVRKKPAGTLFPQLKDRDGNWKNFGGWLIWNDHNDEEPPMPQQPQQRPQPQAQAQRPPAQNQPAQQTYRPSQQPAKGPFPPPWDKNRQQ